MKKSVNPITGLTTIEHENPISGVTFIKAENHTNGVNMVGFKISTHYEFLFKESKFIGVLVETPTERKTYYVSGDGEEKLTDDILKAALKAFAELDFEKFDSFAILFFEKYRHLTTEIIKEKIERLTNSTMFQSMQK